MDTWYSGLVRTLDVLDAAGLEHVGTYRTQQERDAVKIIDVGGIKLAMLAYTFSTNARRWTASTGPSVKRLHD